MCFIAISISMKCNPTKKLPEENNKNRPTIKINPQ